MGVSARTSLRSINPTNPLMLLVSLVILAFARRSHHNNTIFATLKKTISSKHGKHKSQQSTLSMISHNTQGSGATPHPSPRVGKDPRGGNSPLR